MYRLPNLQHAFKISWRLAFSRNLVLNVCRLGQCLRLNFVIFRFRFETWTNCKLIGGISQVG